MKSGLADGTNSSHVFRACTAWFARGAGAMERTQTPPEEHES